LASGRLERALRTCLHERSSAVPDIPLMIVFDREADIIAALGAVPRT
jgi:hypothetical protein